MRPLAKLFVLFFSTLLLMSCSDSKSKLPSNLKLRIGGEPTLLNPILSTDSASSTAEDFIFSGLLRVNSDLKLEPDLADSFEISKDGKTYTFYLKKNVLWHDGHPFDAEDVAFTFHKILDPETRTVRRSNYVVSGKPVQISIVDTHTLKFILPVPFSPFLSNLTMGILPHHILVSANINTTTFNRQPIGTGPFIFDRWESGQFVRLKKFDRYYGPKPKLDAITIQIIPDYNTGLAAFKKGELHLQDIQPKDRATVSGNGTLYSYDTLSYTFVGFNLKHPLFKDPTIRKAIVYGINQDILVTHVLEGFGAPVSIPNVPSSWAYPEDAQIFQTPYDPEKSKQLLRSAGFQWNAKSKLFEKNGQSLQFTLITSKGQTERIKSAEIIQQFLREIGIDMKIQIIEWSALVKKLSGAKDPKDFDAVLLGWSLGIDPDSYSIWHSSEYPNGFNFIGYANPIVDNALVAARIETNSKKRASLYRTAYEQIAKDSPYLFLYTPKAMVGVHPNVKGLAKPGPGGLLNPIESVYLHP